MLSKSAQTQHIKGSGLLTGGAMPDGVVPAMVPKLELEGGAPKGLPQQLVSHADAKHGLLAQQLLHIVHSIGHC